MSLWSDLFRQTSLISAHPRTDQKSGLWSSHRWKSWSNSIPRYSNSHHGTRHVCSHMLTDHSAVLYMSVTDHGSRLNRFLAWFWTCYSAYRGSASAVVISLFSATKCETKRNLCGWCAQRKQHSIWSICTCILCTCICLFTCIWYMSTYVAHTSTHKATDTAKSTGDAIQFVRRRACLVVRWRSAPGTLCTSSQWGSGFLHVFIGDLHSWMQCFFLFSSQAIVCFPSFFAKIAEKIRSISIFMRIVKSTSHQIL